MKRYEYVQTLMGTAVCLTFLAPCEFVAATAFAAIKRIEDKLTVNRSPSEVMQINQASGLHPVKVSPFVFSLIEQAKTVSLAPNSCFNVAIGALVKLWKIGFEGNCVPTDEQIQRRLQLTDAEQIELDKTNQTVFLKKAGMEIDLGAMAKGYAADVVKSIIRQHNIHHAIIDLGGNVLTVGNSPLTRDRNWKVGLQKPFSDTKQPLLMIKVNDKSVVTSGIYERFFVHNSQIYHHILNPKTGFPLDNELESVTVISNSSLEGDIYSTYLYGLGVENGRDYLTRHTELSAIFVNHHKKISLVNLSADDVECFDDTYQLE